VSENPEPSDAGQLQAVRYSLRELQADIEANSAGLGGAGGRLLDQHEIDRIFENGSNNNNTSGS